MDHNPYEELRPFETTVVRGVPFWVSLSASPLFVVVLVQRKHETAKSLWLSRLTCDLRTGIRVGKTKDGTERRGGPSSRGSSSSGGGGSSSRRGWKGRWWGTGRGPRFDCVRAERHGADAKSIQPNVGHNYREGGRDEQPHRRPREIDPGSHGAG